MNPHYIKGTKRTDFQPWIVSKWMIIWLISEINNNNCLSLLIRVLNSKWNSSAEFQWGDFTAQDSVPSWKKETWLYFVGAHVPTPKTKRAIKMIVASGMGQGIFLASLHAWVYVPGIQERTAKSYKQKTLGPKHRRKDSCSFKAYLTSSIHVLQVWSNSFATLFTEASC